jgi:predicted O-linked N-acetylglucosamine transferase (SPINDLY family)
MAMAPVTLDQAVQTALGHHQAGRLAEAEAIYRQVLAQAPDHPDALHLLGLLACQVGQPAAAIDLIGRAIAAAPGSADAHNSLGGALRQAGRLDEAIAAYGQAIALRPDHAEAHNNRGNALRDAGRLDEAITALSRAVALRPGLVVAHNNLGNALRDAGRLDEAIAAYRQAIALRPNSAEAYSSLGGALNVAKQYAEALPVLDRALALRPDDADAHNNRGNALKAQHRLGEAIAAYQQAIQLRSGFAEAHNNLGNALRASGRLDEALAALERATALKPGLAGAQTNLGHVLRDLGRPEEALAAYHRALRLRPDDPEAHIDLGTALRDAGRLEEAINTLGRAIELEPGSAGAYLNLGHFLGNRGHLDDALACFRTALALQPEFPEAASNLAYSLHFHPDTDAPALLAEHRRWEDRFAAPLAAQIRPHANEPSPDRRLRIGYVSPDFRDHVIAHNLRPLFREHDHRQFEIVCYADVVRPDTLTRFFQAHADLWRDSLGRTDDDLARLVRGDGIDVLVDLTLHMERNRLLVFARKPAPVQITFAGYPGTTGLTAIDYRFTDPYLDPPGSRGAEYAEESVCLPDSFWCYDPYGEEPAVNPLPALDRGFVTFGCLNHFAKVNSGVLSLWARVLRSVEGSRLLLLSPEGTHRREVLERLEHDGVAPERVTFVARQPRWEYLELYHGIDVMLDTFPYNGHTTSLDALWMGVPVITLRGRTVVGRAGFSQLTNLGLPELAAATPDDYVRIAVDWAGDRVRLAGLRTTLRGRMRRSPLMDAPRFARGIEAAYRSLWQRWCARATLDP